MWLFQFVHAAIKNNTSPTFKNVWTDHKVVQYIYLWKSTKSLNASVSLSHTEKNKLLIASCLTASRLYFLRRPQCIRLTSVYLSSCFSESLPVARQSKQGGEHKKILLLLGLPIEREKMRKRQKVCRVLWIFHSILSVSPPAAAIIRGLATKQITLS